MSGTEQFYSSHAAVYADDPRVLPHPWRERFLALLPVGAAILELGCGGGHDTRCMIDAGFAVTPTDGIAEIAAEAAQRLGVSVQVLRFEDIAFEAAFDGVYASACLLHVPRADLGEILGKVRRALKPSGLFYASYKAGKAEGHDGFGRYFNYPDAAWLEETYRSAGWSHVTLEEADGLGYDRQQTRWLHVFAQA
ncbi:class I SAM-dependent methyltransferase [Rhizobium oryzicola]|uniref:Class I SAM-dependent methyltransferase n=1 Tax=Rhizobium oryzicola TaxID=1232668 RepID=A0ABT8SQP3_9HYPH|nr:class I SAM-dependent methyltransferase [Rhizobium oryzicola]MDO1580780.1 class I SAM-dependent methyltransferase [Rhizobium oryzicola]